MSRNAIKSRLHCVKYTGKEDWGSNIKSSQELMIKPKHEEKRSFFTTTAYMLSGFSSHVKLGIICVHHIALGEWQPKGAIHFLSYDSKEWFIKCLMSPRLGFYPKPSMRHTVCLIHIVWRLSVHGWWEQALRTSIKFFKLFVLMSKLCLIHY